MIMTDRHQLTRLLLLLSASWAVSHQRDTASDTAVLHPEFVYHDGNWLATFLRNITETFPLLTRLYSIGKSVEGLLTAV